MTDDELIARALEVLQRRANASSDPLPTAKLYEKYEAANKARDCWPTIMYRLRPVVAALGERDAKTLAVTDWTTYRAPREKTHACKTLNDELAWTKTMLRWGIEQGHLSNEPPICKAKGAKGRKHRETAPTEDDVGKLLDQTERDRERVIVLCAADAGMRRNEIRQLQHTWVSADGHSITIPDWAAKGRRGGVVPCTHRRYAAIRAMPRDIRSPYVLTNSRTGGPYSKGRFCAWFKDLQQRAGLIAAPLDKSVHLHDLRHGYATNAVERGVGIEVVSDILRHSSLEQTRSYVQRRPRDLARALERFEAGIELDRTRR
jgi:integrase